MEIFKRSQPHVIPHALSRRKEQENGGQLSLWKAAVVILISMTKDRDALVLEKWVPGNPPQTRSCARFFAYREQSVRIFRYGNGVVRTTGDPLIIRFEEVFLRPPNSPLEQDYELGQAALISIAEGAWNMPI